MKAGLNLIKKKGKMSLYRGIEYKGGKRKLSWVEVINRPRHSTNIVRTISNQKAITRYGIKVRRKKRSSPPPFRWY